MRQDPPHTIPQSGPQRGFAGVEWTISDGGQIPWPLDLLTEFAQHIPRKGVVVTFHLPNQKAHRRQSARNILAADCVLSLVPGSGFLRE